MPCRMNSCSPQKVKPASDMKQYLKDSRVMILVDLISIMILWIIWHGMGKVSEAINGEAGSIEFYGNLFLMIVILMGPLLHIIGTINFFKPDIFKKKHGKGISINQIVLIMLVSLIALSFCFKYAFINYIENHGYAYCAQKSKRSSFSKIYVFVKSNSDCVGD